MSKLASFRAAPIPSAYKWAKDHSDRNGPNVVREAFKLYGLKEIVGPKHSPEIIEMADELGGVIDKFYTADEIPWCGLAVAYWLKKAGFEPPKDYSAVRARDFAKWGNPVDKPSFGDVIVFWRGSKTGSDGHVGLYIGEDAQSYYILGGNQGNEVNISPLLKKRFLAARRCPWKIAQPPGVKPFLIKTDAKISENEA